MAQYASRASVNLHTHIFFKGKKSLEDGYILFIRQNAIQVLIPKYGLEGTLYIPKDSDFVFKDDEPSQSKGQVTLRLFQKVTVQLTLDQSNVQHEKLEVKLVKPFISDFSVVGSPEKRAPEEEEQSGSKASKAKRKRK